MADIANAQVIRFCNERLRPACDRAISAIRTLRELRAEYVASGIGPLVVGTQQLSDSTVADNSDQDGRTRLLGYDVDAASNAAQALLDWLDGAGADNVVKLTKPTVNSQPAF